MEEAEGTGWETQNQELAQKQEVSKRQKKKKKDRKHNYSLDSSLNSLWPICYSCVDRTAFAVSKWDRLKLCRARYQALIAKHMLSLLQSKLEFSS